MVFIYLPCSRWVYNDDMRYLTHYSKICCGRRTTLHRAIRGEKPRYDMQQSTMGTLIEWYHIFGLDWPYRDCMDMILIEDIKCTHDMHKMYVVILLYKCNWGDWVCTIRGLKGGINRMYLKTWILDCNMFVWYYTTTYAQKMNEIHHSTHPNQHISQ